MPLMGMMPKKERLLAHVFEERVDQGKGMRL